MTTHLENAPTTDAKPARRPYVSPSLRHLGNVRDVTLAGGMTAMDIGVQKQMM